MQQFFYTYFNGNLLPVTRLVDGSFGGGTFRVVGMMDITPNSANLVLDYLHKHKTIKAK